MKLSRLPCSTCLLCVAVLALLVTATPSVFKPIRTWAARGQGASVEVAGATGVVPAATTATYRLTAWSELGMHCIDGKDYSIFSVLPPFNIIRAQLINMTSSTLVTSGVTITYQALAEAGGSINTTSKNKTNFWTYTKLLFSPLFGPAPLPDVGLTKFKVQSLTPQNMVYDPKFGYWNATAVPTMPYDDNFAFNPYPMALIIAKDASGNVLSQAKIVLSVSDEMTCKNCHASGSDAAAEPASGWVNNPNPLKDTKLNILKLHDDKNNISTFLPALAALGYKYQASLLQTALSGTPILCAACHSSNALSTKGLTGINHSLTRDMHRLHSSVVNPATGTTLDNATTNLGACYLCHPGPKTLCLRGAMSSNIRCIDCHGNLSQVATPSRIGWITLPACQSCHEKGVRYTSAFDSPGHWRVATDLTFATNANKPQAGADLYRFSRGHGTQYCSACHGSPHAEYPTTRAVDNIYSVALQGHQGPIRECQTCHNPVPVTPNGGPHGMHNVDQAWVTQHHDLMPEHNPTPCARCHGSDYRGTFLSAVKTRKTFDAGDFGTKTFTAGHQVSCYDCHNGPNGG